MVGLYSFTHHDEPAECLMLERRLRNAVEQIETSSNDEAEIRYDGLEIFYRQLLLLNIRALT